MASRMPAGPRWVAIVLIALLVGTSAPLAAQSDEEGPAERLWATLGFGRGTVALAGFGSVRFSSGPHLVSIRASNDAGITTGPSRSGVGALYGRMKRWSAFYLQASAGLGYVHHDPQDGGATDGLGVPLSAGAGWTPLPVLGLGVHAFGNVNSTDFFGGAVLSVDIGWMP